MGEGTTSTALSRLSTRGKKNVYRLLTLVAVLGSCAIPAYAQIRASAPESPKEVVVQFSKMETERGRLTSEGWQEARSFFVRSRTFSSETPIFVVGKTSTVWDAIVLPDGTTEVTVEVDPVGQIDSKLRFTPPEPRYYKNARHFKLVFSDRRWEVGAKGDATKEVTESSRRWLIDEPNDTLMLSITTALRYVSQQRDTTSDSVMKKNAVETLAKLKNPR